MLGHARKPLLVAAAAFVAALVVALAGIAIALTTTVGARWSLQALNGLAPGELAVGGVDGSLAGGLVLTNVRYESPGLTAELARLEIVARLGALLDRRLVLERVGGEGGTITLHGDSTAAAAGPVELPDVPESLAIRSLRVRDLALAGGADVTITVLDASIAGPRIALEALQAQAAGARIELAADVELLARATPQRATLVWRRLAVEAAGTQWSSPSGRLVVAPGAMPLEAELVAELVSSPLPTPVAVSAIARLSGAALLLDELAIEMLGGRIVVHGVANLGARAGYAAVEYSALNPSLVDPRVEGSLDGTLVVAFAAGSEIVAGAAGTIAGRLGSRPLDGTLRARLTNDTAYVDRARVVLEQSAIDVAGLVARDAVELAFEAVIPELANWYPPASGALRASGSLRGPARDPAIEVDVAATGLAVDTLPPLDELSLGVTGTLLSHGVRAAATSRYGELGVRVMQGWDGERLAGTVLESRLAVERAGAWTLAAPARYAATRSTATLERLCYAGPDGAQLCAAIAENAVRVDGNSLPSALAEPWLGGNVRLQGAASVEATFGWRPALRGSFMFHQPTLRVARSRAGEPAPGDLASLEDVHVTGTLTDRALDAQATAALAVTGDPLQARVTLAPPAADGALDAALSVRLTSLELVDALFDDVEELTGSLTANLRATGSLTAPELDGELAVRGLGAIVPALGIEVTRGRLMATPVGLDGIEVAGELCSTGCLTLEGTIERGAGGAPWRATADVTGESFELANLGDLRVVIAPRLALDAAPSAWRVTGDLPIEEGLVAVDAVPRAAVRPLPETVVHGREIPREKRALPLSADVRVSLGAVRFEGLGISAELDGELDVERTAEGRLLVNGTASIEEGTFSAYSQELTIERGDLLFTGPSDNPALDVRATRETEGATVGLTVTGTLRDPQTEIFSMPPLRESEALARLVTGRSLESAGSADAEAIERAALGLGIRRALPALERLGGNVGLEVGVDASNGEGGSALVAGRQLGEDVYLRYKQGLFDDFAGLELVYRIADRFRLRTETGTSQSIDILYERNGREDVPLAETESGFDDVAPRGVPESGLTDP